MEINKKIMVVAVFFAAGFLSWNSLNPIKGPWISPLSAQTACQTHTDCPCPQGCAPEGFCRNLAIPTCRVDDDCRLAGDGFSGRCLVDHCEATSCVPPSDRPFLQSIIDACRSGSLCTFPAGVRTLDGSLVVNKPLRIVGAGGGPKPTRKTTEIRVVSATPTPAIRIEGDVRVDISSLNLAGGGIRSEGNSSLTVTKVKVDGGNSGVEGSYGSLAVHDMAVHNTNVGALVHMLGNLSFDGIYFSGNQFGIMIFDDSTVLDPGMYEITGLNSQGKCGGQCMHDNDFGNIYVKGTGPFSTEVHISNCYIDGGGGIGILLEQVFGEILDTCVNSIDPNPLGKFGDGVSLFNALATMTDSVISNSARSGLSVFCPLFASAINVSDTLFIENAIDLDKECDFFAALQDGGGNTCIQNGNQVACKALSSSLEPPQPLP